MMMIPEKIRLSVPEEIKIQQLLSQFIKSFEIEYRTKNLLSAANVSQQMAKYFNLSLTRYYEFRGTNKANPKLLSAINYLEDLARLRGMSVADFVSYLRSEHSRFSETGELKSKLKGWEDHLLKSFDKISLKARFRFIALCKIHNKDESKMERMINLVCDAAEIDLEAAEKIVDALKKVRDMSRVETPRT